MVRLPAHFAALTGVLAAVLAGTAQAKLPEAAARQLAELHDMVLDRGEVFSASETLARLDAIAPQTDPDSTERGEVAFLRGLILQKTGQADGSVAASIEALRIDDAQPFLSGRERMMANYRVASQAKATNACQTAIPYYQRLIALMAADATLTDSQRLGVRGDLGYCLHEAGRYGEALAINQAVLEDAERAMGPGDRRLLPTLINIAQNQYALHDTGAARAALERVLSMATALHDGPHADTALFQLGVLAFEGGKPDEARQWMQRRLSLAQESGDADRIAQARQDLAVLEEKLAH